jgi:hypothetical protein
VFKGVEGLDTADLGPLSFYYRVDGHCGAGAPRFNLRYESMGVRNTVFFGCNSGMAPGNTVTYEGRTFEKRTVAGPLPAGKVVSLSIVYDEGQEFPPGSVYLDNITAAEHIWKSASDNANDETIIRSSTPLALLLGEPIALALG